MTRIYIGNFVAIPQELFENILVSAIEKWNCNNLIIELKIHNSENYHMLTLKKGRKVVSYTPDQYKKFLMLQKIEKLFNKKMFYIKLQRYQLW